MPVRTAYHEAGHGVLSAAINDSPNLLSIEPEGERLGFTRQAMFARPTSIAQVYVAGFAAEHLLTGRRSRDFVREVALAVMTKFHPTLGEAFPDSEHRDGHRALEAILRCAQLGTAEEMLQEVDRFYEIARESLSAVWIAVDGVAKALIERRVLDRDGFDAVVGGFDIYTPIFAVQRRHGFMPPREGGR
jgi:ATP-dependent Zn protease